MENYIVKITVENPNGQKLVAVISETQEDGTQNTTVCTDITGIPTCLNEHEGVHVRLLFELINALRHE